MRYLIDGYNLLHAMGALRGQAGPEVLEKARLRLLGILAGTFADQSGQVTVVFDAANAPPDVSEAMDHRGIQVRFAQRLETADDLIELLIQKHSAPGKLTLVSDDRRLQQAARKRKCIAQGCTEFVEKVLRKRRRADPGAGLDNKPLGSAGPETEHWLETFGDLENDPAFKELFEPFDFM